MTKNAGFGRTGVLDRLRLWWYAKDGSTRVNALLFLAVGGVVVALVAAATSRDRSRPNGLANAMRPQLTVTSAFRTTPTSVDLLAAGLPGAPAPLSDPTSSTSSTVAVAPTVPPPSADPAEPLPGMTTTASVAPATTVPDPGVVDTEASAPSATATTVAPATTVVVATTAPPSPPAPSSTIPPSTTPTPATTAPTVLPPLIGLPPLLPG